MYFHFFLALSVLMKQMKHKTSFKTDGAGTGLARPRREEMRTE